MKMYKVKTINHPGLDMPMLEFESTEIIEDLPVQTQSVLSLGKRLITVGHTASGHTEDDVDFLCDGTDDDVEIREAIAALPDVGGKVLILEGTYEVTADIAIQRNHIVIEGIEDKTIFKRAYPGRSVAGMITINAAYCTITGLQFDGQFSIYDNVNNCGIFIQPSSAITPKKNIIKRNTFINNSMGVVLFNNNGSVLTENSFQDNTYGLEINNCTNCTVSANVLSNSSYYDISVVGSQYCGISNNYCAVNGAKSIVHFWIKLSKQITVTGNTCSRGSHGMYLLDSSDLAITGNAIKAINNTGIFVSKTPKSSVTGNSVVDAVTGIHLHDDSPFNTVTGNTFHSTSYGVYSTVNCEKAVISGNSCCDNIYGMYLSGLSNSVISGNLCTGNRTASIRITGNNNLITGNSVLGMDVTDGGENNTVTGNKV